MNPLKFIDQIKEMYNDQDPRPMAQGPRNMYSQGQLVTPSVDGSRPGYSGAKKGKRIKRFSPKKEKLIMETFNLTEDDFIKHGKHGVPQKIDGKSNPKYDKIFRFVQRDFKPVKGGRYDITDVLSADDIEFVKNNFDPPKGEEWNFKSKNNPTGFKHGVSGAKYVNLEKQIFNKLKGSRKITLAADRSSPQGWIMHAMERVYNNEIKNKVKFKDLIYKPIKKNGIIIGFTDTTAAGGNKNYYGLKKNMKEDGAAWTAHGDYNRINKFLKIAKGAQVDDPSKLLQKILDDKGITKLLGENRTLRLNDILSHERYFDKISEITPKKLLERQIVLHHTGGVGSGSDLARAAATKDLQLLTGAVNSKIEGFEKIVQGIGKKPGRKLNPDEIKQLKNFGAKITDFDGKVVGGGYTDPTKQFANIEKGALKYAKGKDFNVKTVTSYLERLGCGKSAGGRILMKTGGATLTKCANEGAKKLEQIILKGGANKTEQDLAKKILQAGRGLRGMVSLSGMFGPGAMAFLAGTEAGLVGYDMITQGKTFREAVGDSVFNYALGKDYQIDPQKELFKRFKKIGISEEDMAKIAAYQSNLSEYERAMDLFAKDEQAQKNILSKKGGWKKSPAIKSKQRQASDFIKADIQDLYRTDTINKLNAFDWGTGAKTLKQASDLATIDRLSSVGDSFYGKYVEGPISKMKREREIAEAGYQPIRPSWLRLAFGGRAGYMGGGIAGIRKPSAIPPESGPQSQGLDYLKKYGNDN